MRFNSYIYKYLFFQCGGGLEYFHGSSASRRRRRKWFPVRGGIIGSPLSLEDMRKVTCPPGWGLGARLTTLLRKYIIAAKSKGVKAGQSTLAESSKKGRGLEIVSLPTTTKTMMMMMIRKCVFRSSGNLWSLGSV
jgi:hypothetical protein